jgi:hypothetical protein
MFPIVLTGIKGILHCRKVGWPCALWLIVIAQAIY